MNHKIKNLVLLMMLFFLNSIAFGATLLDLRSNGAIEKVRGLIHQQKFLNSTMNPNHLPRLNICERKRDRDFNQALHIRAQQFFGPYEVWDSQFIIHLSHVSENFSKAQLNQLIQASNISLQGHIYENLHLDLSNINLKYLENEGKDKVIEYFFKTDRSSFFKKDLKMKLMIYLDKNKKAHWAYLLSYFEKTNQMIRRPTLIIDALSFKTYESWNDMKQLEPAHASAIGGNPKTNYFYYDDQPYHFPALNIERDQNTRICYLQNATLVLKDINDELYFFKCDHADPLGLYPIPNEEINGGYSPRNDVLFNADLTQKMFQEWYGISLINETKFHSTHHHFERFEFLLRENLPGAFYYDKKFFIGLGNETFYPYTDLDIIAHELSHQFTTMNSNLIYNGESGAINESFSDMTAKAAEFYLTHKNNWSIESTTHKYNDEAERYFDQPSKNCKPNKKPGERCSIDSYTQYHPNLEIHYASGIFDRVFYLIATAPGWNTKKVFDIMVKANTHYWKENSNFQEAACGILLAAKDYHYETSAVQSALLSVGIITGNC